MQAAARFTVQVGDAVSVVTVVREILDLTVAVDFSRSLDEAAQAGGAVVVDLGCVSYLDSVIISQLVKRFVSLRQDGRRFILCGCCEYVEELLKSTGLLGVIDIRHDVAAARKLADKPVDDEERALYSRVERKD